MATYRTRVSSRLAQFICLAQLVGLVAWLPEPAHAHGADTNTADIRLAGDTAYVVVWPASETFSQFDDNRDGLIQPTETKAHRAAMLEYFRARFILQDQADRSGETVFEDLSTPLAANGDRAAGAEHLRVTLRIRWQEAPTWLVLQYTLFGESPLRVQSSRVTPAKTVDEQRLLAPPQWTVFDRSQPRHVLLQAAATSTTP